MTKRLIALAGAFALAAGPVTAGAVVGAGTPPSAQTVPADASQGSVQAAYLTALQNQINPYAQALATAAATTIVNFYQYRVNSPGDDTIIAFTQGGTAISLAQNVNNSSQSSQNNSSQSISQTKYDVILQAALEAAGQAPAGG